MSEPRRWTIYRGADAVVQDEGFEPVCWTSPSCVDPELGAGEEIEVMPVSEHEQLKEIVRAALPVLRETLDEAAMLLGVRMTALSVLDSLAKVAAAVDPQEDE